MKQETLSHLSKDWDKLILEGKKMAYKKGQVLFYEGHEPYGIFALDTGTVTFVRKTDQGEDVVDVLCGEAHTNSVSRWRVLGLSVLIDGTTYCCTCTASEDCKVVFISKTQLNSVER